MNKTEIAFWVLSWIFAVEHPDGQVTNRQWSFRETYLEEVECQGKAGEAERKILLENLTEDGGIGLYSRFACIPVLKESVEAYNEH